MMNLILFAIGWGLYEVEATPLVCLLIGIALGVYIQRMDDLARGVEDAG